MKFETFAYWRLEEMKKKQNADKLKIYNASHGTERKWVLEKGNVWTRPTMSMELKSIIENAVRKNLEKGWKNTRIKKTASTTPAKSDIEAVVINQEDCLFGFSASTHFM